MRDPRPLKKYAKLDIPTVEELLDDLEPPRRRFLELAGAGAVVLAGGGLLAACGPGNDDDDNDSAGDDDSAPGDDDDDSTPWDDDDGGIDADDDDTGPVDCRLPQKGDHQMAIAGGDSLTYSVIALVTDWSVVSYLYANEDLAFGVLDPILGKLDCVTLPDALPTVETDMAAALTELIRDVGGLTCSVYQVALNVVECLPAE